MPQTQLERLLQVTLTILSTWSEPVHCVWLGVLQVLLKSVPETAIKKLCVPVALHLGEYSQAIATRLVATQLVGILSEYLLQDFRGDILQKTLLLSQDTSYQIRKSMCVQLKKVTRSVSEDLQTRVFEEVLKLVNDEEVEVKREAVSLLIDIIDLLPFEFMQEDVVPVLRTDLLPTRDPLMRQSIAENFGVLIVKMEAELQDEGFRRQCLDFYISLATSAQENERKQAAFTFPAVFSTLGSTAFTEDLKPMYERLSRDPCLEVKQTVAASFHEILRLSNGENKVLSEVFLGLLADIRLVPTLLRNLATILAALSGEIAAGSILTHILNLINSSLPWRSLDKLLSELQSIFDLFSIYDLLEKLQPALFNLYPKCCLPVKVKIAKLLAEIVHRNYISEKKAELCTLILGLLGESGNAQDRIVFIDFSVRMIVLNSRHFFQRHFLRQLLQLASDPVRNVRLKLAMHLVSFLSYFCTQPDMQTAINAAVTQLMADTDSEVRQLAGQVQMQTMSRDYWNAVQVAEREEAKKQIREEQQNQREQRVLSM